MRKRNPRLKIYLLTKHPYELMKVYRCMLILSRNIYVNDSDLLTVVKDLQKIFYGRSQNQH